MNRMNSNDIDNDDKSQKSIDIDDDENNNDDNNELDILCNQVETCLDDTYNKIMKAKVNIDSNSDTSDAAESGREWYNTLTDEQKQIVDNGVHIMLHQGLRSAAQRTLDTLMVQKSQSLNHKDDGDAVVTSTEDENIVKPKEKSKKSGRKKNRRRNRIRAQQREAERARRRMENNSKHTDNSNSRDGRHQRQNNSYDRYLPPPLSMSMPPPPPPGDYYRKGYNSHDSRLRPLEYMPPSAMHPHMYPVHEREFRSHNDSRDVRGRDLRYQRRSPSPHARDYHHDRGMYEYNSEQIRIDRGRIGRRSRSPGRYASRSPSARSNHSYGSRRRSRSLENRSYRNGDKVEEKSFYDEYRNNGGSRSWSHQREYRRNSRRNDRGRKSPSRSLSSGRLSRERSRSRSMSRSRSWDSESRIVRGSSLRSSFRRDISIGSLESYNRNAIEGTGKTRSRRSRSRSYESHKRHNYERRRSQNDNTGLDKRSDVLNTMQDSVDEKIVDEDYRSKSHYSPHNHSQGRSRSKDRDSYSRSSGRRSSRKKHKRESSSERSGRDRDRGKKKNRKSRKDGKK